MALKVDHLSFMVESLHNSMPYYDCLLGLIGFEKLRDHVWSDGNGLFFQFRQANAGSRAYERYAAGMNHIGFAAPSAAFVTEVQSQMQAAGFLVPEIQAFDGATALFMKDPDDIRFEITYTPPNVAVVD